MTQVPAVRQLVGVREGSDEVRIISRALTSPLGNAHMGASLSKCRRPRREYSTGIACPDGAEFTRIEIELWSHQIFKDYQHGNLCQTG